MNEPYETICAVEDALHSLQILATSQPPTPHLAGEVKRLEARLRQLEALTQGFICPA